MADEKEPQADAPKGKSKLLLIIIIAVVVLLGGGGAAFFLMGSGDDGGAEKAAEVAKKADDPQQQVTYVSISQPFVFNVTGEKRDRMVQLKVQLMVRGPDNEEKARYHSPLIESTLLSTFAAATVKQLRSPTGRIDLREKATDDVRAAMNKAVGKPVVEKVLFTDFVMQ